MDKNSREFADELKIKEEQLRLSLEAANAGMWVRDTVGVWKATPLLNTLFGRSIDDPPLLEEEFVDYIHPEDLPRIRDAYIHAREGKSDYSQEYRVIWPDGSIHWLASKGKIVLENDKSRFIGITYEITGRKEAEKSLKESESRFHSLYENSFDAILLTKPDGSILAANPAAQEIFDRTEEEIIKASRAGLIVFDENLKHALKEREEKGKARSELTAKRKDGSTFPVEITSSLFTDADGITKTSMIIRDLTERKKAEEELKESKERFRVIANESPVSIAVYRNKRNLYVNPAASSILGYTKDELLKMDYMSFIHPDYRKLIKKMAQTRMNGESGQKHYEIKIITKNGQEKWLETSSNLINYEGLPAGIVTSIDITERKKLEEELKKARDNLEEKVKERTSELEEAYKSLGESEEKYRELFNNVNDMIT